MFGQRRFPFEVIFTVEITLIGHQRHFGVDHHVFTLWQTYDHVWLHTALAIQPHINLCLILMPFA
ncbi:hypothetical protein D3C87_2173530 [compost metagenome]